MKQEKIQSWIERIPRHIQEIIRLEGDNSYREGRGGGDSAIRPYNAQERHDRHMLNKAGQFCTYLFLPANDSDDSDNNANVRITRARAQLSNSIVVPLPIKAEAAVSTALRKEKEADLQEMMKGLSIHPGRGG